MGNEYITKQDLVDVMDQKIEEFAVIVQGAFQETNMSVQEQITGLRKELKDDMQSLETRLSDRIAGVNQQLLRHMQITDDQHHEMKHEHRKYERWFDQLSRGTKIKLDPPLVIK